MSGPLATLSDSGGNIGRVDARRLCSTEGRRQHSYFCASKASKLSAIVVVRYVVWVHVDFAAQSVNIFTFVLGKLGALSY